MPQRCQRDAAFAFFRVPSGGKSQGPSRPDLTCLSRFYHILLPDPEPRCGILFDSWNLWYQTREELHTQVSGLVGAAPQGWSSQKPFCVLVELIEESVMRSSVNGKTVRCELCFIYSLRIDEPAANCALLRHTYRVAIPHKQAAKTENALCSVMASPYCSWLALKCRGYGSIGMRSVQSSSSPVLEPFRALLTREPDPDELLS